MRKIDEQNNPFGLGFGMDPKPSDPLGGEGLGGIPTGNNGGTNFEQDPPSPEGMFEQAEVFTEGKPKQQQQQPQEGGWGNQQREGGWEEQDPYQQHPQQPPIAGGLKAGALVLLVFIGIFVYKGLSSGNAKRQNELESFIKQQPSGGYVDMTSTEPYVEPTPETQEDYSEPEISTKTGAKVNYITEIARYTRQTDGDNRTYLNLTIEGYGEYKVHIPYYEYEKLDKGGYVLVDMELVKDKVTFVYISNKQENLKDLLNK